MKPRAFLTSQDTDTVTLTCEKGHQNGFTMAANREWGEFTTGEIVSRVPLDSYAYTHGGCCYQAAVDALHGCDVFHGVD